MKKKLFLHPFLANFTNMVGIFELPPFLCFLNIKYYTFFIIPCFYQFEDCRVIAKDGQNAKTHVVMVGNPLHLTYFLLHGNLLYALQGLRYGI